MYYHGSVSKFSAANDFFCVTGDRDVAIEYLQGNEGFIYSINLGELKLASIQEAKELAEENGVDIEDYYYDFEIADSNSIREILAENGFDGISYQDLSPDNNTEHETILIFSGDQAVISSRSEYSN